MSLYAVQKLIYQVNRDPAAKRRCEQDLQGLLSEYDLTDEERAKILGLNAARIFKFDIPERYKNYTYSTTSK